MQARLRLLALASAGVLLSAPAASQIRTADVTGGAVEGTVEGDVASFKGIPFAAPPVGALRWRAPQPVEPWDGVLRADTFGPSCMQAEGMLGVLGAPPAIGEDCLYLNVWTPAEARDENLPVMVWIYGGGFAGGSTAAPAYTGRHLAERGVVVVSIAYRVGPFGFLAHPELSREGGDGSGNYGLLDMIAGLRWVRDNVAGFGGDPDNVTIFGESAGGYAVSMLAASPPASGLFDGVISESGGSFSAPRRTDEAAGMDMATLDVAEAEGEAFLGELGADDIEAARALDADVIQQAMGPGLDTAFWPNVDGRVLLGDQYDLYERGRFNDTPILVGTNSDEGRMFLPPGGSITPAAFEERVRSGFGEHADAVLAAYPHSTDAEAREAMKDIERDSLFGWHTWAWARLQDQRGEHDAYVYYFDHRTPQSPDGANHAAEIPYVFGTLEAQGGLGSEPRPADREMSELMMSYWVNFARTGDPNGADVPSWPAFETGAPRALVLDDSPGVEPLPNLDKLTVLDGYFEWRREQALER